MSTATLTSFPPAAVNFTVNAATKVQQLIDEAGTPELKLRAYVMGGGCSGLQYGFKFDEKTQDDDTIITQSVHHDKVVSLLIDSLSMQYLEGAEIDYQEDIMGAQFVIRNLKSKGTCGCGSSFQA